MVGGSKSSITQEYESILCQIKDIISARVVLDKEGVQEIHILAANGRSPKQIVRDIESALLAQFNMPIDHKKISVAQLDWDTGIPERDAYVKLVALNSKASGSHYDCSVALEIEGEKYAGQAQGAASSRNRLRLLAEATLEALEMYLKNDVGLAIEELRLIELGTKPMVVASVIMVTQHSEETLAGACFVAGDTGIAVVQAVLKAAENRLPIWTDIG